MKRSWFAVCLFACLLVGAAGAQATLTVSAPPDRLALPGDFVTLVFRVTSSVSGTATLDISSEHGYTLLTPPDTLALQAGVTGMVPVTVEVPADAPALTVDSVSVTVSRYGQTNSDVTRITVGEKRGLAIQGPGKVDAGSGAIPLTLNNNGNVTENAVLEISLGGHVVASRPITLPAGAQLKTSVPVHGLGSYEARLLVDDEVQAKASFQVVREGVPAPPPLQLRADVSGSLDSSLDWGFGVQIEGPLSDYARIRGNVFVENPRASYVSLRLPHVDSTVGALSQPPLGLPLPSELGARGSYSSGPWSLGAATTQVTNDRYSGYVFGGWDVGHTLIGAAAGMHAGAPMVALRIATRGDSSNLSASADALDGQAAASFKGTQVVPDTSGSASFAVEASHLMAPEGAVRLSVSYSDPQASIYGDVTAPFGSSAVWSARGGAVLGIPSALPGDLYMNLQGGSSRSFATLGYTASMTGGWQTVDQLGVIANATGTGLHVSLSAIDVRGPGNVFGASSSITYYPAPDVVQGSLNARYGRRLGPATLSLSGSWNLGAAAFGLGSAVQWRGDSWDAEATANTSYDATTGEVSATVSLSAHVAAEIAVPTAVVQAMGGRRYGELRGRVHAGDAGIPDVSIKVGGYRVHTDAQGAFSATLPPGTVNVSLELATLPIQYAVDGPSDRELTIEAKHSAAVDFPVVATAGIAGRILLDTNADGEADVPPTAVTGTVVMYRPHGAAQIVAVGSDGSFTVRGILPGSATLELSNLPDGYTVEGSRQREIALKAGDVTRSEFLVVPVTTTAPVFSPTGFRIRSVATQVDRAPPGSAPLVTVQVEGEASSVSVIAQGSSYALRKEQGVWTGRVPIPSGTQSGVLGFEALAKSSERESRRHGQFIVDPNAPAFEIDVSSPARPDGNVTLTLTPYLPISGVRVSSPFGGVVRASGSDPGLWTATVPIPGEVADGVYVLHFEIEEGSGKTVAGDARFRVASP